MNLGSLPKLNDIQVRVCYKAAKESYPALQTGFIEWQFFKNGELARVKKLEKEFSEAKGELTAYLCLNKYVQDYPDDLFAKNLVMKFQAFSMSHKAISPQSNSESKGESKGNPIDLMTKASLNPADILIKDVEVDDYDFCNESSSIDEKFSEEVILKAFDAAYQSLPKNPSNEQAKKELTDIELLKAALHAPDSSKNVGKLVEDYLEKNNSNFTKLLIKKLYEIKRLEKMEELIKNNKPEEYVSLVQSGYIESAGIIFPGFRFIP